MVIRLDLFYASSFPNNHDCYSNGFCGNLEYNGSMNLNH
jgi:hypothetical protein